MGGQSAPQPPKPITPGQAAQAAVGTAGAGEMMSIADQPIEQYANLATTTQFGPAEARTQQALANQAALQSAQGQMAIQSQVDPLAYAQRQMRLKAATDRLGQLYGQSPSAFNYQAPGAFQVASMANVPALSGAAQQARDIASNLSLARVSSTGTDPSLYQSNPKAITPTFGAGYY